MIGYLPQNYSLVAAFGSPAARRTRGQTIAANRIFKAAPKLADCFREADILGVKGELDRPISGLAIDSRRVLPGNVFFALPGGPAALVDEAVSRGAVAVVAAHLPPFPPARVTFIRVADPRRALAGAAQRFYKFPDRDLGVIGVTGAHGKTPVAHLLQFVLSGDQRVGLLGSIHYDLGARTVPSYATTPESLEVFGLLAQMREAGCRQAVLEVGAESVEQQRVRGLHFGAVVFTAGATGAGGGWGAATRLVDGSNGFPPKIAVVNLDDAAGAPLAHRLAAEAPRLRVVTYGENRAASVRAEQIRLQPRGTTFRLVWPGGALDLESPLVGRGHVTHLLAAIATAWGLGRDPLVFLAKLRAFPGVAGRLERVAGGSAGNIFVDGARSPEALARTLDQLRPLTPGRLRVVFGAVGQRDRALRASLLRTAEAHADAVIVTADNPRSESLAQIFADLRAGSVAPDRIAWIADRRAAIARAVADCRPGDTLVIAGKGHETVQECADTVFPFDDRQVVREVLSAQTGAVAA